MGTNQTQAQEPNKAPSLPSDTFTREATSTPATASPQQSTPSAQPSTTSKAEQEKPAIQKPPQPSNEERVKQARALLETQIKQIAKRENIPENMVRLEVYLESRMRKLILPKIDRLASDVRSHREETQVIKKDLASMLTRTFVIPENGPPSDEVHPEDQTLVEATVTAIVAEIPEPVIDPNDPLFGSFLLYLQSGESA